MRFVPDYFAGDDAFDRFAMARAPTWSDRTGRDALLREAGGDLGLAMMPHDHPGDGPLGRLDRVVTLWVFLGPDHCCRAAVARLIACWVAAG